MFKWLTKQAVQHPDGFIVESTGRFTIAYREQGKVMTVEVENGRLPSGSFCVEIHPSAFLHWDGESILLPTSEQERIERNFTSAMRFQGIEVVTANPDETEGG